MGGTEDEDAEPGGVRALGADGWAGHSSKARSPSWRVAVANLRNLTAGVTPKQRKLAARVGLQLPKSLPRLVAAARLKVAYSAELCTEPVQPATDSQLDYLSDLNKKRAGDAEVHASRIEASAWIEFYLMKQHREALEKLRLEAGDIVQIEDSGGVRHEEVASIAIDGRIFFRGGHGASAFADRVTLKCRAANNSAKARALKKATANKAAERSTSREFSRVKELELRRFRVATPLRQEDIDQLRNVIDLATDEKPIQSFLETRPQILAALLGGRSRFVVPRPELAGVGGKRVPDFLLADVDSAGVHWLLVELETPVSSITLKNDNLLEEHARKGSEPSERMAGMDT